MIRVTVDKVADLLKSVESLTRDQVLVGVPSNKAPRQGEPINNATLAYIHNFGSPARNIPQREFMEPGIRSAEGSIIRALKTGALDAIEGNAGSVRGQMTIAGQTAADSIKAKITDGPFAPLSPATTRRREAKRRAGWNARGHVGTATFVPLIDTGKLRQSITFVIRAHGAD